jgi:hypothetical protein
MPRDSHDKPYQLKPVDNPSNTESEIVRLDAVGGRKPSNDHEHRLRRPSGSPSVANSSQEPVQRLVPEGRVDRKAHPDRHPTGDPSAMMESAALPVEDVATLEEVWGKGAGRNRPILWGWVVLAALIAGGTLAWSFREVRAATVAGERQRKLEKAEMEKDAIAHRQAEELVEEVHRAVAAFLSARNVEEMARHVRHTARVRPMMEAYYNNFPLVPTDLQRLRIDPQDLDGRTEFMVGKFRSAAGEGSILIEMGADGKARIDWETYVGYQPMDWDHYAMQRPEGSMEFRVFVTADDLYSDEFRDADQWMCFRLTALNSTEELYGYARRNSPAATQLILSGRPERALERSSCAWESLPT